VTGDRSSQDRRRRDGIDYVHAIVDDHSRLAYAEIQRDQRAATVAGFLERALAFYERHGVIARRLMTDNAWVYVKSRSLVNTKSTETGGAAPDFAFLTSYGKTLLLIADDPRIRMRDIAERLNVTERATQRIVADLARAGYIDRQREGRRNRYSIRPDLPLGRPQMVSLKSKKRKKTSRGK